MIRKYATFWNIYLVIIFIALLLLSFLFYAFGGGGLYILPFLYTTVAINLLSDKLFNNIKKLHIFILLIIIYIYFPILEGGQSVGGTAFIVLPFIVLITIIPIIIILILRYFIKRKFSKEKLNSKKASIIILTLYLIFTLSPIYLPFMVYLLTVLIPIDPLIGGIAPLFAIFFVFFMLTALMFFEKDKKTKYLIAVFIIINIVLILPFIFEAAMNLGTILIIILVLTYIIPVIVLYILTLLDIVVGKFYSKLNDYATKIVGISAISFSIFIIVYTFIAKWSH